MMLVVSETFDAFMIIVSFLSGRFGFIFGGIGSKRARENREMQHFAFWGIATTTTMLELPQTRK
jgi:hypothetical protein